MGKTGKICGVILLALCLSLAAGGRGSTVQAAAPNYGESRIDAADLTKYDYGLDVKDMNLLQMDEIFINGLANIIFLSAVGLGNVVVTIYQNCTHVSIGELFADQINAIQGSIYATFFQELLWAGLAMVGIKAVMKLWRRNFTAILGDLVGVGIVMGAAFLVTSQSALVIDTLQGVTAQLSDYMVVSISMREGDERTAVDVASDALWQNLIRIPWENLEFGSVLSQISDGERQDILETTGKERREKVKELAESDGRFEAAFDTSRGKDRVGSLLLYYPIMILKAFIFMFCSVLQMGYQLMTILFVFLAPLVLVLSLFPGFDFKIIEVWLRKILALQISTILAAMMLSVLLLADNWIMSTFGAKNWLAGNTMESLLMVGVFLMRKQILSMLDMFHTAVQNPGRVVAKMQREGGGRMAERSVGTLEHVVKSGVKYGVYRKVLRGNLLPAAEIQRNQKIASQQAEAPHPRLESRTASGESTTERQPEAIARKRQQQEVNRKMIPRPSIADVLQENRMKENVNRPKEVLPEAAGREAGERARSTALVLRPKPLESRETETGRQPPEGRKIETGRRPLENQTESGAESRPERGRAAEDSGRRKRDLPGRVGNDAPGRKRALAAGTVTVIPEREKRPVEHPELAGKEETNEQ